MCSCSAITQTLYTVRHDRMLRPVYYAILKTLGITNNEEHETIPWYRELQPKCCVETIEVKVLWNIPLSLNVVLKDGAKKPDIALYKKNASGSYLKELYVTWDRFKNETNRKQRNILISVQA